MFRIISIFLWLLWLTATPVAAQNNPIFTATNNNKELLYLPEMPSNLPAERPNTKGEPCDLIELNDGNEIIAHIVEEQPLVVKYYECDDKNKKLLLLSKSKIKRLRY
ncbi:MAG: hypothetical protein JNM36_04200, partial [Chitinophagales bacterium]|nr:hypothetical protein [Chitinophagales bacterium]